MKSTGEIFVRCDKSEVFSSILVKFKSELLFMVRERLFISEVSVLNSSIDLFISKMGLVLRLELFWVISSQSIKRFSKKGLILRETIF